MLGTMVVVTLIAPASAADVYVSPTGSDKADGSAATPVATLRRALDRSRELRAADKARAAPVVIELTAGRHELATTLVLDAADSGTPRSPTILQAAPGTQPIVSGGRIVTGWKPVTDEAVLARLPSEARGHVFQADLKTAGIAGSKGKGMTGGFGVAGGPGAELFHEGRRTRLARYPNKGFIRITEPLGPTPAMWQGKEIGRKEGIFKTNDQRVARWAGEPAGMVHGYWCWDWADERQPIASIDPATLTIALGEPHHGYGYRAGQWFYGFNLLCELDAPGEWFFDRGSGIGYFRPDHDGSPGRTEVSHLDELVRVVNASHIVIRDLVFEAARGTALSIDGGRGVTVGGCTFRNLGGTAVKARGIDHRVVGCDIHAVGDGGIDLSGGDRRTLAPGNLVAENNHIHHYATWNRTYRSGIQLSGVGNRAVGNLIHDAPHMAIGFSGNDHVIERNEIHHVCTEAIDAGAVYAGRSWTCRGNVIRHNHFHDINGFEGKGCVGVYLDDCLSSARIEGNLFRRVTKAAFIGGGRDNVVSGNVFVECSPAVHVDARGLGWGVVHRDTLRASLAAVPSQEEPWRSRYPELRGLADDPLQMAPAGNLIERNIQWRGTWSAIEPKANAFLTLRANLLGVDPGFVDEKKGDFRFKDDSLARQIGLTPIPLDSIGLRIDGFRRSLP